jgi:Fe2+ transport system protein B
MTLFALPGDVAVPVLMASIRKDGIILLASPDLAATMSAGQLLASVYLAGVLLPCVVTFFTVVKERNFRFGAILIARQAAAALLFTALLAWSVRLIGL